MSRNSQKSYVILLSFKAHRLVKRPKGQWWCQGCVCLGAPPSTGLSLKGKARRMEIPDITQGVWRECHESR